MLKHLYKLLDADCRVVMLGGLAIYPIFKVGSTSLFYDADSVLVNEQIRTNDIVVFIREPRQRFIKGVNQYCKYNGLDVQHTHDKIRTGEVTDRHFAPQLIWLLHLYKYHKGTVTLRHFNQLGEYTDLHEMKDQFVTTPVEPIDEYVSPDLPLLDHIGNTVPLGELLER